MLCLLAKRSKTPRRKQWGILSVQALGFASCEKTCTGNRFLQSIRCWKIAGVFQITASYFTSRITVLVQSEFSTVPKFWSSRIMHFSMVKPPAPSELMFVTYGPALLLQPVRASNAIVCRVIYSPLIVYCQASTLIPAK